MAPGAIRNTQHPAHRSLLLIGARRHPGRIELIAWNTGSGRLPSHPKKPDTLLPGARTTSPAAPSSHTRFDTRCSGFDHDATTQ
jgi:hypothetical protein